MSEENNAATVLTIHNCGDKAGIESLGLLAMRALRESNQVTFLVTPNGSIIVAHSDSVTIDPARTISFADEDSFIEQMLALGFEDEYIARRLAELNTGKTRHKRGVNTPS